MKEFIEIVVLPPTSLFILGGAGLLLLLLRVRFGAFLCVLALIILYALSTPAVARAIGRNASPEPLPGDFPPGDDGKLFAAAGIPYVKIGPGSFAGRDPRFGREQVPVEQLLSAARAYVILAAGLAAADPAEVARWPRPLTRPDEFRPTAAG